MENAQSTAAPAEATGVPVAGPEEARRRWRKGRLVVSAVRQFQAVAEEGAAKPVREEARRRALHDSVRRQRAVSLLVGSAEHDAH